VMSDLPKVPALKVADFDYDLPTSRIAFEAVEPRDSSKLLVYGSEGGVDLGDGHREKVDVVDEIGPKKGVLDLRFSGLLDVLDDGDFLVANDTKVIPARLHGKVVGGGHAVEVFLLNPLNPEWSLWEAMVGNRRKFKEGACLAVGDVDLEKEALGDEMGGLLKIEWHDREKNQVRLILPEGFGGFVDAIEHFGKVPLPPYIERELNVDDKDRYQAIFAQNAGAVAAPTASLHFTDRLKEALLLKGVGFGYLTLHVGAGTFKPMTSELASDHEMHSERFEITVDMLDALIVAMESGKRVVSIGTTVMRVLESIYYIGCRMKLGIWEGRVNSTDGYDENLTFFNGERIEMVEAMRVLRKEVSDLGGVLRGETQIFIVEGFEFRVVDGLITNFHQPKSTLLMLVSAFCGGRWRDIYKHAMGNGYRFLSYGDGSLLWR
jgi:S-adenosylmethionine:tRNA ribosyltransferase-isomerase